MYHYSVTIVGSTVSIYMFIEFQVVFDVTHGERHRVPHFQEKHNMSVKTLKKQLRFVQEKRLNLLRAYQVKHGLPSLPHGCLEDAAVPARLSIQEDLLLRLLWPRVWRLGWR